MKTEPARLAVLCLILVLGACNRPEPPPPTSGVAAPAPAGDPAAPAPEPAPAPAPSGPIDSFEACVAAGHPVMESYPPQCRAPGGQTFTEDVGNRVALQGMIQVDEPTPNQVVASPLTMRGKARGPWYFEASFPARLVDERGATLATAIVQADGEWMTEDFVPFSATFRFTVPEGVRAGRLVLDKSNASGLPEHDASLVIPVRF
jgi:hypothetical protein